MKTITEAGDLKGKRVLVRVDWSVPMKDGVIANDYQIRVSLPTLTYLQEAGAIVTIATHLESLTDSIDSLRPYVPEGMEILPNLRANPGEIANSQEFAQELASQADVYVNEAFAVSHREHASIVGVPKLIPGFLGLRFAEEVQHLSQAFHPPHPFLFLLGGAKVETKLPLIEKFSSLADSIFIGGAMAKQASEIGLGENSKVFFPTGDLAALDANAETLEILKEKIKDAALIVWNGPLGKYEDGYTQYTEELARALSEAEGKVIVGGGDTLVAIQKLNLLHTFSFVSAGGGAMLDFLATGTLPGIEVLTLPA
jgi:phosphoglycerate kinase